MKHIKMQTINSVMDSIFCRCLEGRVGRALDKNPDMAWIFGAEPLETRGVCHANGYQYYSWRGIVWPAHHGRFHFCGILSVNDCNDIEMESLEYNRTLEIW
jgi:hypothetical protein